jgi:ribosome-binding protein aMBF1 (putative translation factor)
MGKIFQQCQKCKILIDETDSLTEIMVGESSILLCQKCISRLESNQTESKLLLETI